ncbi:Guanylate-binding family protein, partial [Perilla frutescens var. hirtella]
MIVGITTSLVLDIGGVKTSVFYLDTEGFESIGKSSVYDDRIFVLATVMSSVLVYNLPATNAYPQSEHQAFYYLEKAVDQ